MAEDIIAGEAGSSVELTKIIYKYSFINTVIHALGGETINVQEECFWHRQTQMPLHAL